MFESKSSAGVSKVARRPWVVGALVAAGVASVVLSVGAIAAERGEFRAMREHGGACMHAPEHGGAMGMPLMGGRALDRMLDDVKATDEQRKQIRAIADQARDDLRALHKPEQAEDFHQRAMNLWTQAKVDAGAAEKLRLEMQAHHDQISKRMTQAMLDVARVLTPEQRSKLAQQMQAHHDRMKERLARMRDRAPQGGEEGASAPKTPPAERR